MGERRHHSATEPARCLQLNSIVGVDDKVLGQVPQSVLLAALSHPGHAPANAVQGRTLRPVVYL